MLQGRILQHLTHDPYVFVQRDGFDVLAPAVKVFERIGRYFSQSDGAPEGLNRTPPHLRLNDVLLVPQTLHVGYEEFRDERGARDAGDGMGFLLLQGGTELPLIPLLCELEREGEFISLEGVLDEGAIEVGATMVEPARVPAKNDEPIVGGVNVLFNRLRHAGRSVARALTV